MYDVGDVCVLFFHMEFLLVEDTVLVSIVFTLIIVLVAFSATMAWGFITVADCLALDFDSTCYSVSPNKPTGGHDDPMWWPHENKVFKDYGPPWPLPD
jgi:hypothetical protein